MSYIKSTLSKFITLFLKIFVKVLLSYNIPSISAVQKVIQSYIDTHINCPTAETRLSFTIHSFSHTLSSEGLLTLQVPLESSREQDAVFAP